MKSPLQQAKELHKELLKTGTIEAQHRLAEFMSKYTGEDEIVESTNLIAEIEKLENEKRYYTGIKRLDEITDGFRSNQLVVISSPPKSGKTQLCVHLAKGIKNATMFLFEESAPEVLYKYYKKGLELPHFYTPKNESNMGVEDLYRKMIEAWAKYDSRVFFIDHLHFILDKRVPNVGDEIRRVMEELKKFAKMHGFTIFIVAHMTKGHFDEPPGVEAIRDSAHIPALADTVILMWRETYQPEASHKNVREQTKNLLLNIALNRKINFKTDKNTGLVDLTFNTETWSYEDSMWYTDFIEEKNEGKRKGDDLLKQIQS